MEWIIHVYPSFKQALCSPCGVFFKTTWRSTCAVTAQYQARSQSLDLHQQSRHLSKTKKKKKLCSFSRGGGSRGAKLRSLKTKAFLLVNDMSCVLTVIITHFNFNHIFICVSFQCDEVSTKGRRVSKLPNKVQQNKVCLKGCWLSRLQVRWGHMTSHIHQTHRWQKGEPPPHQTVRNIVIIIIVYKSYTWPKHI